MRRARWKKKSRRGLWDTCGPIAPQKRELNSPEVWRVSVVPAARRASGGHFKLQQPTGRQRLKGFQQPLAAAAGQLKKCQSPKMHPMLGAPLQVPVLGAGAAHRTPLLRKHRPSGRERSEAASSQAPYPSQQRKRRRSLIPLLVLFPREPLCWVRVGAL